MAGLASGLEGVTVTTVHAAVLAALFAQNGQYFPPYLIDDAKNILGLGFYRHAPRPQRLLADDLNFLRVKKAMAAVVEDEKGTGRRLRGSRSPPGHQDRDRRRQVRRRTGRDHHRFPALMRIPATPLPSGWKAPAAPICEGASFLQELLQVLYPE